MKECPRPIVISQTATVKARVVWPDDRVSAVATRRYEKTVLSKAVAVSNVRPGVAYSYYESEFRKLPDFSTLQPVATGVTGAFDLSPKKRDSNYALLFNGYLKIPADGVEQFFAGA